MIVSFNGNYRCSQLKMYIAIDISEAEKLKPTYITKLIQKIKNECGEDVSLSTHTVFTESNSWESVAKADKFFKDVEVIDDVDEFIRDIKKDRTLKGVDVAKYILSRISCTHLGLQELVYLCFKHYLCKTKRRLFEDRIYELRNEPIVETVYNEYKKYGGVIEEQAKFELPARSRILFAEDGISKLICIDETLKKYKEFSE